MTISLNRFAALTSGAAFFLLFAGGLVTSTGSGLAVPDWPLSFGQYFPAMVGGVLFEHGHRVIAGTVGIMTFALAFWVYFSVESGAARPLAAAAAGGILIQALLGGITVLYRLPKPVSIAHACLGQAVFCLILAVSQATSDWWDKTEAGVGGGLWRSGAWLSAAVYAQLAFGAIYRHTGLGISWHLAGAGAVFAAVAWVAFQTFRRAPAESLLTRPAGLLAIALPAQMLLGVAAYARGTGRLIAPAAVLPTAHLAVGAVILGASVVWSLRAWRLGR